MTAPPSPSSVSPSSVVRPAWRRVLAVTVVLFALIVGGLVFFPWDLLRGPVNRYVSAQTGRHFEITRRLDVNLGWRTATISLDGVEFANPAWAREPYLVKAERAVVDLRLWPLWAGRIELPRVQLSAPRLGLQMEADGRRTWALGKADSGEAGRGTVPTVGALEVDGGELDFLAEPLGVDLQARFTLDPARGEMPLRYSVKGRYQRQALSAEGRAGGVLQLAQAGQPPFPIEVRATAGRTQLVASGTVATLQGFDGIDGRFDLKGQTLGDLYGLLGVALPQTSPYAVRGELRKRGKLWELSKLAGRLGLSDIGGQLSFDQQHTPSKLSGVLQSKVMDMDDLGPLIGLAPTARSAKAIEGVAPPPTTEQVQRRRTDGKVLPTTPLDFERLRAMNADVRYSAERIRNVRDVPLDRGSVHVKLEDAVLALDPLDLAVAGGKLSGAIRIAAGSQPADIRAALDVRGMQLARLVPKLEASGNSVGRIDGRIRISGPGSSVAGWLGSASGDAALLMGAGQFGNLLPVFATLVGGDILKFLVRGDRDVQLRCAAVAFDVNKGVMDGRTLVLDTSNAIFQATGQANLARETLDFVIHPEPKSKSILSIRTPLKLGGTFANPRPGVEVAPLLARAAGVVAGAAVNPLLALAATLETGPGQDADCTAVLRDARTPDSRAATQGAAKAQAIKP